MSIYCTQVHFSFLQIKARQNITVCPYGKTFQFGNLILNLFEDTLFIYLFELFE